MAFFNELLTKIYKKKINTKNEKYFRNVEFDF